jgi:hypothetical protein
MDVDQFFYNLSWDFCFVYYSLLINSTGAMVQDFMTGYSALVERLIIIKLIQMNLNEYHRREGVFLQNFTFERLVSDVLTIEKGKDEKIVKLNKFLRVLAVTTQLLFKTWPHMHMHEREIVSSLKLILATRTELDEYEFLSRLANVTIKNKLLEIMQMESEMIKGWQSKYEASLATEPSGINLQILNYNTDVAVSLIALPDTYAEFHALYLERKCELCNSYSNVGTLHVCLVCGMRLCSISCHTKKQSLPDTHVGNLTLHSRRNHANSGLFLDIKTARVCVIHDRKAVGDKLLYTDAFGQEINLKSKWTLFRLDEDYYAKLRMSLLANTIPQQVGYVITSDTDLPRYKPDLM